MSVQRNKKLPVRATIASGESPSSQPVNHALTKAKQEISRLSNDLRESQRLNGELLQKQGTERMVNYALSDEIEKYKKELEKVKKDLFSKSLEHSASSETEKDITNLLVEYSDAIYSARAMGFAPEAWFREYIKSDAFSKLDPEFKDEAFEMHVNLTFLFKALDDIMQDQRLGIHEGTENNNH